MVNQGVEEKASETALFAALRRMLANRKFHGGRHGPDYLAEHFLPPRFRFFLRFAWMRKRTNDRLNHALPGLNETMIARTAHFDQCFKDALTEGAPQIVLLGAGYDSRAYRFAALNRGTRVFELDIAPTQKRKRACLAKAGVVIPEEVTLVPIDFNKESVKEVLENAGYENHLPARFLWEGVSYYLEAASVDAMLGFVARSHPESTIAFDYTVPVSTDDADAQYGAREFAATMKEHHAGEQLLFSIGDGEISAYLERQGLKMIEHLDNEAIERKYLVDEEGSLLGRMTGHFRFVSAAPAAS